MIKEVLMPKKTKEKTNQKLKKNLKKNITSIKTVKNIKLKGSWMKKLKKVSASHLSSERQTVKSKRTKPSQPKLEKKSSNPFLLEYYDLPYGYPQTVVKILAQTPHVLFVYWNISEEDRTSLKSTFGESFFSSTKPILLIHNHTKNYTFELEINDFANSWYIQIADANCYYTVELGRKPYCYPSCIQKDYVPITSSNPMDLPNDHVLQETNRNTITYRNVKTQDTNSKSVFTLPYFQNKNENNPFYDLYQNLYPEEVYEEIFSQESLTNPTSLSSSRFLS